MRWRRWCATAVTVVLLGACGDEQLTTRAPDGDPDRGRELVREYSCGACHSVPGVDGADGLTAPPLDRFSRRAYVAGILVNEPENLVRWLQSPQTVQPGNGMPDLGIDERDARDLAAYLLALD